MISSCQIDINNIDIQNSEYIDIKNYTLNKAVKIGNLHP